VRFSLTDGCPALSRERADDMCIGVGMSCLDPRRVYIYIEMNFLSLISLASIEDLPVVETSQAF
jgi:hypothetical protein